MIFTLYSSVRIYFCKFKSTGSARAKITFRQSAWVCLREVCRLVEATVTGMNSEASIQQQQHPAKFRSFPGSNRLMNSEATGGRDLVSCQCKIGQRLHKWTLSKWPSILSFVCVTDGENCIMRIFIICTLSQTFISSMKWARHAARTGRR